MFVRRQWPAVTVGLHKTAQIQQHKIIMLNMKENTMNRDSAIYKCFGKQGMKK